MHNNNQAGALLSFTKNALNDKYSKAHIKTPPAWLLLEENMSNKASTKAIYKELKKNKKPIKEQIAAKKAYQKERSKKMKELPWWIPK